VIILHTNVVSEIMRPRPAAEVLAWLDAQAANELWLTSSIHGAAARPSNLSGLGKRRLQIGRSAQRAALATCANATT